MKRREGSNPSFCAKCRIFKQYLAFFFSRFSLRYAPSLPAIPFYRHTVDTKKGCRRDRNLLRQPHSFFTRPRVTPENHLMPCSFVRHSFAGLWPAVCALPGISKPLFVRQMIQTPAVAGKILLVGRFVPEDIVVPIGVLRRVLHAVDGFGCGSAWAFRRSCAAWKKHPAAAGCSC